MPKVSCGNGKDPRTINKLFAMSLLRVSLHISITNGNCELSRHVSFRCKNLHGNWHFLLVLSWLKLVYEIVVIKKAFVQKKVFRNLGSIGFEDE